MKVKVNIILVILFISCTKSEKEKIELNDVIKNAEILCFSDLDRSQKEKLEYCCFYYPKNWRDGVEYKKKMHIL
ncbi:hypothetical protein [Flavobacterium sp. PL02]|uniref:hypothetical protein n=1 Tax=Flavobacterium sp. PL02 TaxID=3088354 RepID=UPI002B22851A|nr:hypothetical protein [Flavobacterium sp. PL02]MEA9414357.1 hypothetical protein [Flavobacterium sp. PL02]